MPLIQFQPCSGLLLVQDLLFPVLSFAAAVRPRDDDCQVSPMPFDQPHCHRTKAQNRKKTWFATKQQISQAKAYIHVTRIMPAQQ